ncbi:MAG: prolyl oligopeptidase family serine peptidase [bacterium]|nr:prolyl oligopeptidase family serine peptidase [bacterium]
MHLNKRNLISLILLTLFILTAFSRVFSQERGIDLYEKLLRDRRNLISYSGPGNVNWTPDGEAYYVRERNGFIRIDPETGDRSDLFNNRKIIDAYNKLMNLAEGRLPFRAFEFIESGNKIKFYTEGRTRVFFYDLETETMRTFKIRPLERGVRGAVYEEEFSPDYKYTAFTDDFNLYLRDIDKDEIIPLTTDGHNDLRNGYPDWVYAEEFGQFQCFWWSPDSKKIAYMQFDESPVKKFPVLHDEFYDFELEMQSFPRVGENNPIVRFYIVDVETKEKVLVDTGIETNVYLYNGRWSFDGKRFSLKRMNRLQNMVEIVSADPETGESKVLFREEEPMYITEGTGFMQEGNEIYFLPDNKHFLRTSERTGWREIFLYDLEGNLIKQLTDAELPVQRIQAVDMDNELVFFTAYGTRGTEQHLYSVKLNGSRLKKLTNEPGTHNVRVSPGGKFFSDRFSSFDTPTVFNLYKGDGTLIRQLGNSVITDELKNLDLIEPEHFMYKSADGKYDLDGIIYKPADFDENKKYPAIYSVYCGPGTKEISNSHVYMDRSQVLAQLGFLVVRIDNRGLIQRGKEFESSSYMVLGQTDVDDLVASVKYLSDRPYFDNSRIGIFGGSYGGYMAIMTLLKAPQYFHVGVANSPGVDWRNYDSIYTERYMGLPMYNKDGYEKANPMNYAENLGGRLLIQHGAVDDNVHPTQVMQIVYALLQAGKDFDWFLYPGMAHGVRFPQAMQKQMDWFIRYLEPETKEEWFSRQ